MTAERLARHCHQRNGIVKFPGESMPDSRFRDRLMIQFCKIIKHINEKGMEKEEEKEDDEDDANNIR